MKRYYNSILGPSITIFLSLLIEGLRTTNFGIPNPPAFLLLAIVYSSFAGGLLSGFVSAAIGWLYIAYFFSSPSLPFQYSDENLRRVEVWAVTIPFIVVMVGVLKRRSIQALYQQLKEKDQATEQMRQEEEKVHAILDSAYDAFVAASSDGLINEWNKQAEIMFGWKREEVQNRLLADMLIPTRFRPGYHSGLERFLQTGVGHMLNQRIEFPVLHRDGHEIQVELTVVPVRTNNKYIFSAFLHDIAVQKRQEQIQKIQLSVTRILVGSLSISDAAGKVLETISKGLGYEYSVFWELSSGESPAFHFACAWHEDRPALQKLKMEYTKFVFHIGNGLPGRVGQTAGPIWASDIAEDPNFPRTPLATKAGLHGSFAFPVMVDARVVGVMEFFSGSFQKPDENLLEMMADIGSRFGLFIQRHLTEQELRKLYRELELRVQLRTQELLRTEIELRLITDALPVGIAYIDKDQRYKFCNDTYCKWNGRSREQIIGSQVKDILGQKNYGKILPYLKRTIAGQQVSEEVQIDYATHSKTIALTNVPDFDDNGSVRGFVILLNDISQHKEIESQLKHAKEAAEAANEAKSAFLANMSHEIRTPLGAVLGFSELLVTETLGPVEKMSYVQAIKRNGDLLSGIINDILDISKVESGKLQVERREVSLSELLSDIMTILNLQAQEKKLKLSVEMEGNLPDFIATDPIRLRQILLNIVGNAIKFTQTGSIRITVKCLTKDARPTLAFAVKDSGMGITPEQASKLFQPFTQADETTKRKFGGTGLGLVLSKRLAQLLGGTVELTESELGQGSVFTITIDPGSISKKTLLPNPRPHPPSASMRLDGVHVLLAEDSHDNQVLVSRVLTLAGAAVDMAENGKEAIAKAMADKYDVVLMDLQMPVTDGYEATSELRRAGYDKPIVALTAHALKEERERCLASGFNDHLSKPIDRQILIERVAHFGKKQ